jgi:tRNA1(Val) A37 N6-methylase TrmN6
MKNNEKINYIIDKKIQIVQNSGMFCFSIDSVLLPNFINYKVMYKKILDIGTGNAPIPLIISTKTNAKIDAIEIQSDVYQLACKSIEINNLNNQINAINDDVNEWYKTIDSDIYDLITCNPPYFNNENKSEKIHKVYARHEETLTLKDLMTIARKVLKNKGRIVTVNRPENLINIITTMKENNIEPKRLRFVYPKKDKDAKIVLVEGVKNGKPSITIERPLYIHDENGEYSLEIKKMFE